MSFLFNFQETISAFVILFAVIDIVGSIPVILTLKEKTHDSIHAGKAALYSLITFLLFLFMGNIILSLFNVDISSFAVAGALVVFVVGVEMTFGVEIFKFDGPDGSATLVPLVFPLIAGAASFTTLLSLRAEYNLLNILIALFLNIVAIYLVI
ncbi:MAG TPA: MarC family protein, partial [Bacteroidales bacterium]